MEAKLARLALIRQAMPGVAKLVAGHRKQLGDAFVTDCIQRGLAGEPGFFFAREGALAVGTPWPAIADIAGWQITKTQVLVCMREAPSAAH